MKQESPVRSRIRYTKMLPSGMVALSLSYATHGSLLWAFIHGLCGWFYVPYWLFNHTNFNMWIQQFIVT